MNTTGSDKPHHRRVTLISLALVMGIYGASQLGLLGDRLEAFAPYYLVIVCCILGGRAILTELGVRRRRLSFENSLVRHDNHLAESLSSPGGQ
jgi:hypothetical protein